MKNQKKKKKQGVSFKADIENDDEQVKKDTNDNLSNSALLAKKIMVKL